MAPGVYPANGIKNDGHDNKYMDGQGQQYTEHKHGQGAKQVSNIIRTNTGNDMCHQTEYPYRGKLHNKVGHGHHGFKYTLPDVFQGFCRTFRNAGHKKTKHQTEKNQPKHLTIMGCSQDIGGNNTQKNVRYITSPLAFNLGQCCLGNLL